MYCDHLNLWLSPLKIWYYVDLIQHEGGLRKHVNWNYFTLTFQGIVCYCVFKGRCPCPRVRKHSRRHSTKAAYSYFSLGKITSNDKALYSLYREERICCFFSFTYPKGKLYIFGLTCPTFTSGRFLLLMYSLWDI